MLHFQPVGCNTTNILWKCIVNVLFSHTYPVSWNKLHACEVHAICMVSTATMIVIPTVIIIEVYKKIGTKYLSWSIPYSLYIAIFRRRDLLRGSTTSRNIGPSDGIIINIDIMVYINTANLWNMHYSFNNNLLH